MKRIFNKEHMHEYWRKLMDSTRKKMSSGAQAITKLITHAHGDNWRRKEGKK
ncbi:MAG TPA: hypothetical protein VGW78_06400 [Candidatus Babeliales bacterium]|jgi:uncharacterized Rossmann fold enzyme|nr:hypothetical protein [Candidatus Babeliales bacterium]